MNTKNIKNSDDSGREVLGRGEGGEGGRARGPSPCLLSISVQPCPPRRGTPAEPRGLARGGRHKSMGAGGTSTPYKAQGQGKRGIIKAKKLQN